MKAAWRALFARRSGQLYPLDALRAMASLWMVAFHAIFYLGFFLPRDNYAQLLHLWGAELFVAGQFGVDLFFVLSGFLLTTTLKKEWERKGDLATGIFYLRRIKRIYPAYMVVLAITLFFSPRHLPYAWTNVLGINNFVPVHLEPMAWSWSLAIELQFYALLPWWYRLWQNDSKKAIGLLVLVPYAEILWRSFATLQYAIALPPPVHPSIRPSESRTSTTATTPSIN